MTTSDNIAAIEIREDIRTAAVNLVDTLVLERETNGQSMEFMDWAYFMAARALLAEARKAEAMKREIAEKDARIAALEAGLRAFAECAGEWDGEPESLHVFFEWNDENTPVPSLPVADFRRARTLLNGGSDAQG